jgi:hypothetical protein
MLAHICELTLKWLFAREFAWMRSQLGSHVSGNGTTKRFALKKRKADDGVRTRDLRFTKPLLYQLSYVGEKRAEHCIPWRFTQARRCSRFAARSDREHGA